MMMHGRLAGLVELSRETVSRGQASGTYWINDVKMILYDK